MNFAPPGRKLDHPTHAALARADVIVADDKTLALQLGGRIRVVDRHLVGRPDIDARDAGPPHRAGAGKALVGRDDGLALRIMSGDDAAYFECHGFPHEFTSFGRVAFDRDDRGHIRPSCHLAIGVIM